MPTKREYLASLNPPLAKPGRGRFSAAAKLALAEAEANGVVFTDVTSLTKESPESSSDDSEHSGPRNSGGRSASTDWKPEPISSLPTFPTYGTKYNLEPKVRNVSQVLGKDSEGRDIAFAECARCHSHVNFCHCTAGIKAPAYVAVFDSTAYPPLG